MNLIFWIIIGIISASLIFTTLWIFFNFLRHLKRDYNLYKSVSKSVFSRKLSLSIIIIFYLISFGLVGGLTSALGRLNSETTSYIKDNHLHQGVLKQASYNKNAPEKDTLDQKSFYLATQGVIDFYNEELNPLKKQVHNTKEKTFINMIGGQEVDDNGVIIKDGDPTLKEILDGSTSPLSFNANNTNVSNRNYQSYSYSMIDVSFFWNTWYYDSDFELEGDDYSWKNYYYNGKEETYDLKKNHKESEIIKWVETQLNNFIFTEEEYPDSWTFDSVITDENTFSSVVYDMFGRDLNKYYSTISTYIFEYYLDQLGYSNQFASTNIFEYQKHAYNKDFLLQSYNKSQASNENTFLNNSGNDDNGDYSIDTVKFYDNNGKEIKGPSPDDPFFETHAGTIESPYQIYLSTEYYEANNFENKIGKTQDIFINKKQIYYQVNGSYRSPTYTFPIQTVSNSLQDPADNAAILINTQSLLRLTRSPSVSTTNYEFFGFSNVYNDVHKATDWYYSEDGHEDETRSPTYPYQVTKYVEYQNNFFGDKNISQSFYLNGETLYAQDSLISYRSFTIIQEIYGDQIFFNVIMAIFLIITIIVLILLIKKRISDSNKQIGTIKALGLDPSRIASAYTIFPIIIIIFGGIFAVAVALPLSLFFTTLYGGFYSLNLSGVYVGLMFWLKIFIFPLILSMFIGYWMAYHTIRKPTLDLLNNVDKDKPNWLVRLTSPLIPSFASFDFTYKIKGIGRATFKSLLLFFAIVGSMSITAFAFASSTMTSTMTKEVFDVINYESKSWEYGAPFVEDININEDNYHDNGDMEAFDLFENSDGNFKKEANEYETLIEYVFVVLKNPNNALGKFQTLLTSKYPESKPFDFTSTIDYSDESSPIVTSNYYIEWKTAIALWVTNIALHVPTADDSGNEIINEDLNEPIYSGENGLTFEMLNPLLHDYGVNLAANVITRYGTESTFELIQFVKKILDDYNNINRNGELKNDLDIIRNWLDDYNIRELSDYIFSSLEDEYIFNDIVFNQNYYDGEVLDEDGKVDSSQEINQSMGTSFDSFIFKTDINGELIPRDDVDKFKNDSLYMEGYASIDELIATNDVGPKAEEHINDSKNENGNVIDDKVVNVAMTEPEYKKLQAYKAKTPKINDDLSESQARVAARLDVWDTETNSYKRAFIPVIIDVEIYDSIFPLGTFFLEEDMNNAVNKTLEWEKKDDNKSKYKVWARKHKGYSDVFEHQLTLSKTAVFESNYSVTYNIDTNNENNSPDQKVEDFITAPLSISLAKGELSNQINIDQNKNENTLNGQKNIGSISLSLTTLVNNFYTSFPVPISIDIIVEQGSKVYDLLQGILYIIALFALFIGTTIVMIAMKDIIDSNKREVSMFKAFGYSNRKATSLVLSPYIFVIVLAFIVAIPLSLFFLSMVGTILTAVTGMTYVFVLSLWQWIVVIGFIVGLVAFLGYVGYKSYQHTNALDAISETNE